MVNLRIMKKKGKNTKVKRSHTGLGLFADEFIPRDTFIIDYVGERISNEEADRRGGKYLFEVDSKTTIDGKERKNTARYINHSCRPNAETEIRDGEILVFSKQNIKNGTEITFDYGKEYFDEFIKPFGCQCDFHRKKRRNNTLKV
jgi:SET domain-containing protein